MKENKAHIIVFGNEKGGTGKSTAAMQTAIALLRRGYKVGTIDLDARQGTMTAYMKNRWAYMTRTKKSLPVTTHMDIESSSVIFTAGKEREEHDFLFLAMSELHRNCDFIVIDTPGSDTHLSRTAHGYADTLVTPLNDSLIDLDLLARIDPSTRELGGPSVYTKMVEKKNDERTQRGAFAVRWIVMRNRVAQGKAKSRPEIEAHLATLADRYNFTLVEGFGDRIIFRDMFIDGLAMADLAAEKLLLKAEEKAAWREVNALIDTIDPEDITQRSVAAE
ncbi:MAG TPA: division plane positioning ATPase MipZ [Micavibrio sp.]|jgi:chromosome partitioning protein